MAYSSITQLRKNCPIFLVTTISDADVTDRIDEADNFIITKLSSIVDFTLVIDTPAGCPIYINKLSQFKTAELCLVAKYGAKRQVDEQSDRQYWAGCFTELLDEIIAGHINLGAPGIATGTFVNDVKKDIPPALGMGEEAEFINDDARKSLNEKYGGHQ